MFLGMFLRAPWAPLIKVPPCVEGRDGGGLVWLLLLLLLAVDGLFFWFPLSPPLVSPLSAPLDRSLDEPSLSVKV